MTIGIIIIIITYYILLLALMFNMNSNILYSTAAVNLVIVKQNDYLIKYSIPHIYF
jgi:hypothetical protein